MCWLHDRSDDIKTPCKINTYNNESTLSSGCSLTLTDWEQTKLHLLEIYIKLEVMISYNISYYYATSTSHGQFSVCMIRCFINYLAARVITKNFGIIIHNNESDSSYTPVIHSSTPFQ